MRTSRQKPNLSAFTLIELLVVVSIIGLLVAILLPSFSAARNTAKRATVESDFKILATGLNMFKGDHESRFRQTNGFPSSKVAEDRAETGVQSLYGAHWLVYYMGGKDLRGYISRKNVPPDLLDPGDDGEEVDWYDLDSGIERSPLYVPVDKMSTARANEVLTPFPPLPPGFQSSNENALVFTDAWGGPILYYAASSFGNSLCGTFDNAKEYYNHDDNVLFTGESDDEDTAAHKIAKVCPDDIDQVDGSKNVDAYIHDERVHEVGESVDSTNTRLVPHNRDSFILISAGPDFLFGTSDDVRNFEN